MHSRTVPLTALQDLKECYRPHRYHPHPGQLDQYHFHFRWIFFHQTLAS